MFFKVGVLKNLAMFTGKHLPQDLQFYLKKTPTGEPVQYEISVAMWRDYKSETLILFPWIPP